MRDARTELFGGQGTDIAQKFELPIGQVGDAVDLVLAEGKRKKQWTGGWGEVFTGRD